MDCFLKDDPSSGFLERAPVRLEVRSSRDVVHAVRGEPEWPLARPLSDALPRRGAEPARMAALAGRHAVEHPARRGRSSFAIRFDEDVELTGYMRLRLWVQAKAAPGAASPPDDMAVFVAVGQPMRTAGRSTSKAWPATTRTSSRAAIAARGWPRFSVWAWRG